MSGNYVKMPVFTYLVRYTDNNTLLLQASGGGPNEDNITGFLVRSIATRWAKNSVLAVDAGSHLAAITRLLAKDFPLVSRPPLPRLPNSSDTLDDASVIEDEDVEDGEPEEPPTTTLKEGPFAGMPFPNESARANALHLVRECISTYLITHPHLDHISGMVINTAGLASTTRPKRLTALPSTVNAIKAHIFNDIIWPNLTDEDGGVGFVTFQRLPQGGNNMVGEGRGLGYIEVCDGLCVKGMKVSHGHCMRGHQTQNQHHRDSEVGLSEPHIVTGLGLESPRKDAGPLDRRTPSISQVLSAPGTPGFFSQQQMPTNTQPHTNGDPMLRQAVVDSTAYFIRDDPTGREVLIFGDVEPDLVSLNPRTAQVWAEAAPKIVAGSLRAIFIECSYDDSQADAVLFGHLAPRHLVKEMVVLANIVKARRVEERERREGRKRKRSQAKAAQQAANGEAPTSNGVDTHNKHSMRTRNGTMDSTAPSSVATTDDDTAEVNGLGPLAKRRVTKPPRLANSTLRQHSSLNEEQSSPSFLPVSNGINGSQHISFVDGGRSTVAARSHHGATSSVDHAVETLTPGLHHVNSNNLEPAVPPLDGLKVVIIHMKDTLRDGPLVGDSILAQLKEHEAAMRGVDGIGLGCEWIISKVGESYWV